jgi:tRNA threonylcarbamoyladenosine biosynthesis protein TsaE
LESNKIIFDLDNISAVAEKLISASGNRTVWFLYGEMGMGKTTLIKEICKKMNVTSEMSSPTFSIVNEYITTSGTRLFHFDLYRIKKTEELNEIGFQEYIGSKNYCFIEWPEILPELDSVFKIKLSSIGEKRLLEYN